MDREADLPLNQNQSQSNTPSAARNTMPQEPPRRTGQRAHARFTPVTNPPQGSAPNGQTHPSASSAGLQTNMTASHQSHVPEPPRQLHHLENTLLAQSGSAYASNPALAQTPPEATVVASSSVCATCKRAVNCLGASEADYLLENGLMFCSSNCRWTNMMGGYRKRSRSSRQKRAAKAARARPPPRQDALMTPTAASVAMGGKIAEATATGANGAPNDNRYGRKPAPPTPGFASGRSGAGSRPSLATRARDGAADPQGEREQPQQRWEEVEAPGAVFEMDITHGCAA